jgi:hypothetical protein
MKLADIIYKKPVKFPYLDIVCANKAGKEQYLAVLRQ